MKHTSYKSIITNIARHHVETFVEKRNGGFLFDYEIKVEHVDYTDEPRFTVNFFCKKNWKTYEITGYVSEFGTPSICTVYEEFETLDLTNDGEHQVHRNWYYGDDLRAFQFSK